jgi:hypothetical protein
VALKIGRSAVRPAAGHQVLRRALSVAHLPKRTVGVLLSGAVALGQMAFQPGRCSRIAHTTFRRALPSHARLPESRAPCAGWLGLGGVRALPEPVLSAVGRLTVAAIDLEFLLAWIGADQEGGDAAKVFATPGEPLRAARGSVEFAPVGFREAFIGAVREAAGILAEGQAALRCMWTDADDGWSVLQRETKIGEPVEPALLNRIAVRLMECRERLNVLVEAQLRISGGQP